MGFGYLLIGYLITYLLKLTAGALGVGFLALLIGYGCMLWGCLQLKRYCGGFVFPLLAILPLLLFTLGYHAPVEVASLLGQTLSLYEGTLGTALDWCEFFFTVLYHFALLSALREMGMQVELKHISDAAVRNMIVMALYALLYVLYWLPIPAFEGIRNYFGLSISLFNIAWLILDLLLLLSCTKNICAEGQEEPEPKQYRWGFLNRMGEKFSENMKKASDSTRADAEDYLRQRQEKRRKKEAERDKPQHHKKKKKK